MKLSAGKFLSEMKKIEQMLVNNLDAEGSSFTAKVVRVQKQVPKGVGEKLSFLADLYDRIRNGEKPDPADLKQAGFWINAVWPYVSNGAQRGLGNRSRFIWIVLAIAALAVAYYFLH